MSLQAGVVALSSVAQKRGLAVNFYCMTQKNSKKNRRKTTQASADYQLPFIRSKYTLQNTSLIRAAVHLCQ